MLFLLFHLDRDRYAIEAGQVVSVLPLVRIKTIPHSPAAVAGLFDYHGELVPLIDLCELALGRAARRLLSTRIIVVNYPDGEGAPRKLGLIAEQVLETLRRDPHEFEASAIDSPHASYLGPVLSDARGPIQRIEVGELLPEPVRELLFQTAAAQA